MKLATIRVNGATRAVKAEGTVLIDLGAAGLGELANRVIKEVVKEKDAAP